MPIKHNKPIRVLSLSGGGMRGLYSATYLQLLSDQMAHKEGKATLDIGASFDLITGTSTGGILAGALATGIPMHKTVSLYKKNGAKIFPQPMASGFWSAIWQLFSRSYFLKQGEKALKIALQEVFDDTTIGQVYDERKIALAIPAVEMTRHGGWVFKTPHLKNSNGRDDKFSLVDVCLATSAAPLFRSMASIQSPSDSSHTMTFVDGGLWANDPILIGLIDALEMSTDSQPIEIYCIGTCKRPVGETITPKDRHRGLISWKFGGEAASLAIDAQEFAYGHMARMLSKHVSNEVKIITFPSEPVSASAMKYLALDETRPKAMTVLADQARADVNITLSKIGDSEDVDGQYMKRLFEEMKEMKEC